MALSRTQKKGHVNIGGVFFFLVFFTVGTTLKKSDGPLGSGITRLLYSLTHHFRLNSDKECFAINEGVELLTEPKVERSDPSRGLLINSVSRQERKERSIHTKQTNAQTHNSKLLASFFLERGSIYRYLKNF